MKKLLFIVCILSVSLMQAQDKQPTYEIAGDLVKATYYYANGSIEKQGFFKNKKLTGEWTQFDQKGNKIAIGHYKKGKKVGKWFIWSKDVLTEINYKNYTIASINTWRQDTRVAVK
ncbi:MAG: nicotinic acid mononucleotide adenyltransferase [Flavobacteriaceae bacterium]